jgi:hypothetical protein
MDKIRFDLSQLNEEGLTGPPDGLRSLDYEFCIPADEKSLKEVRSVDPEILLMAGSKGRIGCSKEEYLCIGNTHRKDYKNILLRLASLNYIREIRQCDFE